MKKLAVFLSFLSFFFLAACSRAPEFVVGEGKVLLEEFSDQQCPACAAAHPLVAKLKEHFGEDLVVRFVHFPLESIHQNAFHAAEASECARDLGGDDAFWGFVEQTYKNQDSLNDDTFTAIAADLGLDATQYATCLTAGEKASLIRRDMAEGRRRQVNGTPTFFLEGEKYEGDRQYEVMVKQIEALLEAKKAQ